jgi:Fur family peroxide stress response transcriptional regulator
MSHAKQRMIRAFREAGQRITRQREAVFDYLSRPRAGHPSARKVYEDLREEHAGISVATVYNTLGALVRLGRIKVIEFESGDNRYEINLDPHINLICLSCRNIADLDVGPSIHVECARKKLGFSVKDFRLEYYGHCADCARAAR